MTLRAIPPPDLDSISIGAPTLWLLETAGYAADGRLLLVKATYTDAADGGGPQHHGYWIHDLRVGAYTQNLTLQWRSAGGSAAGMEIVDAILVGRSSGYEVVAKVAVAGPEPAERLVRFDATGLRDQDLLASWLGMEVTSRIERFAVSAEGRFLALQTDDPNLMPEGEVDTNELSDIVLVDRLTGAATRVTKVGGAEVHAPAELGSIRTVEERVEIAFATPGAFVNADTNAAAATEAERIDAYLWTSAYGPLGLVGQPAFALLSRRFDDGKAAGQVLSDEPVVATAAGVFFTSESPYLVSGDRNAAADVFWAAAQGPVQRVGLADVVELDRGATLLDVDPAGLRVALSTDASPVSAVPGLNQAVIVERGAGQWVLASQTRGGLAADDMVIDARLSPVSRNLAFTSAALNLAAFEPSALQGDLYVGVFNRAPALTRPMANQVAYEDAPSALAPAASAFADADAGDELSYAATLVDGSPLPAWLVFNPVNGSFSGTPLNGDVGKRSVKVSATDRDGLSADGVFDLQVINTDDEATGTLGVTGAATQGGSLTAILTDVSDADGPATTSYRWQESGTAAWTDLSGATAATLAIPGDQSFVGKQVRVVATTMDTLGGTSEFVSDPFQVSAATGQIEVEILASPSMQPMPGVDVLAGVSRQTTDTAGLARFSSIIEPSLPLSASVNPTAAPYSNAWQAVTLRDAVSILKMIAGQSVNADGSPAARFQSLAADFDGSGTVSLADALGVLRHAVGIQASAPTWVFVKEGDDGVHSPLVPGLAGPVTVEMALPGAVDVNLIGVLRGDVDGSWDAQRFGVSGGS